MDKDILISWRSYWKYKGVFPTLEDFERWVLCKSTPEENENYGRVNWRVKLLNELEKKEDDIIQCLKDKDVNTS